MFFIEKSPEFDKWLRKLKDLKAKAKRFFRIRKIENDEHFADCKQDCDGISEPRVNFAQGYRIYYKEKDGRVIVLLIGGNKPTQQQDLAKAKEIWKELNN